MTGGVGKGGVGGGGGGQELTEGKKEGETEKQWVGVPYLPMIRSNERWLCNVKSVLPGVCGEGACTRSGGASGRNIITRHPGKWPTATTKTALYLCTVHRLFFFFSLAFTDQVNKV